MIGDDRTKAEGESRFSYTAQYLEAYSFVIGCALESSYGTLRQTKENPADAIMIFFCVLFSFFRYMALRDR